MPVPLPRVPTVRMATGGNLRPAARKLANAGRNGDSTLVHMQPQEVRALRGIGQMTTNPRTGLPEAFSLGDILKVVIPAAAAYFAPDVAGSAFDDGTLFGSEALANGVTAAGIGALGYGVTGNDPLKGALYSGLASGASSAFNGLNAPTDAGTAGDISGTGTAPATDTITPAPGPGAVTSTPINAPDGSPATDALTSVATSGSTTVPTSIAGASGAPLSNADQANISDLLGTDPPGMTADGGNQSILDKAIAYAKDKPLPVGMGALALFSALNGPSTPTATAATPANSEVATPLQEYQSLRSQSPTPIDPSMFTRSRTNPGAGNGFFFNNINQYKTLPALAHGGSARSVSTAEAAKILSSKGHGHDTMLAHINPREAAVLKAMGGRGIINPRTGLPGFDDDDDGDDGGDGGGDGGTDGTDGNSGDTSSASATDSNGPSSPEDDPSIEMSASSIADQTPDPSFTDPAQNSNPVDPAIPDFSMQNPSLGNPSMSSLGLGQDLSTPTAPGFSITDPSTWTVDNLTPTVPGMEKFGINTAFNMAAPPLGLINSVSGLFGGPTVGSMVLGLGSNPAVNNMNNSSASQIDPSTPTDNLVDPSAQQNQNPVSQVANNVSTVNSGVSTPLDQIIQSMNSNTVDPHSFTGNRSDPGNGNGFFFNGINQFKAAARGGYMRGIGMTPGVFSRPGMVRGGAPDSDARTDDVNAKLSKDEYVMDGESVALLGNGSSEAGAKRLDQMRANLRRHKGKALAKGKFSPNAKRPEQYLKRGVA